jgi:hypothetical protein
MKGKQDDIACSPSTRARQSSQPPPCPEYDHGKGHHYAHSSVYVERSFLMIIPVENRTSTRQMGLHLTDFLGCIVV